jgi:hypothetical protein
LLILSEKPKLNCTIPVDKIINLFPFLCAGSIIHTIRSYGNPKYFTISKYLFHSNEMFKVKSPFKKLIGRMKQTNI